jgi:hypothetical protein
LYTTKWSELKKSGFIAGLVGAMDIVMAGNRYGHIASVMLYSLNKLAEGGSLLLTRVTMRAYAIAISYVTFLHAMLRTLSHIALESATLS